jgi:hypothetical protein
MTEAEWLGCTDITPMLEWLRGQASDRKLRLFACACCSSYSIQLPNGDFESGKDVAEQFADGNATLEQLAEIQEITRETISEVFKAGSTPSNWYNANAATCESDAFTAARETARIAAWEASVR